jgi:hypothetical protein
MIEDGDLGRNSFATPEAAEGSRFAGIPGYVIQSDLLKPIANTLSVRDDTFRIRAYGEANDKRQGRRPGLVRGDRPARSRVLRRQRCSGGSRAND